MLARSLLTAASVTLALLMTAACSPGTAQSTAPATPAATTPASLSQLTLPATTADGMAVSEVSGLAWDATDKLLYAVSDQGKLYSLRVRINGGKLASIEPVAVHALVNPATGEGSAASSKHFNAEGLAFHHNAKGAVELIVAMEEDPPEIGRFNAEGTMLGVLPVPAPANDASHYAKSKKTGDIKHGLEAVALHPSYGLLTAPESPLLGQSAGVHTLYANGHAWSFDAQNGDSRIKGIEVLPDGSLLVLERSRPTGAKTDQVASLRRVNIDACKSGTVCQTQLVALLPTGVANFEGMTMLDPQHVLLASDNGGDTLAGTIFSLVTLP